MKVAKVKSDKFFTENIIKTAEQEKRQIDKVRKELMSLTDMTDKLVERREEFAIESKMNDITYVRALDVLIKNVLDGLVEAVQDEKILNQVIKDTLKEGNFKALKDLMVSFGIVMEKRELLLGFDETRVTTAADKKRMKLKIAWQGANGEQNAVQVET
jgi:hypothetical protein